MIMLGRRAALAVNALLWALTLSACERRPAGEVAVATALPANIGTMPLPDTTATVLFAGDPGFPCRLMGAPAGSVACAQANGLIVLPHPCLPAGWPRDRKTCHELLHHNGWPANHPMNWMPGPAA